ncbi:MAG: glycosyltransferase [Caulobacteraceae bacterium]
MADSDDHPIEAAFSDSRRTEAEQRAFFDDVMACTREAFRARAPIEHVLDLAGVVVRLLFSGPRLEQEFMGALAHLKCDAAREPSATFYVWDSDSTGVAMVPPPCHRSAFTDRGDIWGFSSLVVRSAFHWSEFSVNLLDVAGGVGVYWIDTTDNLPFWTKSAPLRSLFHWLMEHHGLQLMHAAAFGDANGGVLVTGKGGVGKSTTALAALDSGMDFIGNDYLVVGLEPVPTAYTLYATAKLEPHQAERFPGFAALAQGPAPGEGEKVVLYLHPDRRSQIVRSLPLKWVLTPKFNDSEETGFEAVSPVEVHRASAFTSMSQLPHAGIRTHDFIGRLIEQVPSRRILLGRDIPGVPRAIRDLLSGAAASDAAEPERGSREPLISVIIPVFNGAAFLHKAVASVLSQNYSALEIIVVDDGSTDDIEAAVRALPIDVRFFRQDNGGPASARNRGIRDASGEFLAFLDVDDLWPQHNLKSLLAALDGSQADVALGRGQLAQLAPETGELCFVGNPEESFPYYIGAALYRREAFQRIGLFDAEMRYGEDTDWYNRAKEGGLTVQRLDQVSLIVCRHAGNMTRGKSVVELAVLRVAKKVLDRRRQAQQGGG